MQENKNITQENENPREFPETTPKQNSGKNPSQQGWRAHRTTKKQKICDYAVVDTKTGEVVDTVRGAILTRDYGYKKMWVSPFAEGLEGLTGSQMRVALWIINHMDIKNTLVMSQREIAKNSKTSLDTVSKTITYLQREGHHLLVKVSSKVYMVNPDIIWRGGNPSREIKVKEFQTVLNKAKKKEAN